MRVEPELPDHTQYKRLKRRVGDFAMEALIRLWAHCQQNQRGEFWRGANAEYLELTAEWDGEPGLLYRSLTDPEIGFVVVEEGGLRIHNWEEMNPQIVSNWKNGPKGGRPKKTNGDAARNPLVNQSETLRETQTQPGLPAISGGPARNPLVNPILDSVNPMQTHREPYQRNERNVTNQDERNQTDRTEPAEASQGSTESRPTGGMRYDLAVQVILFLNAQTGAEFKGTRSEVDAVAACLASVGNDFEGVKKMVARQVALWSGAAKTSAWLQPRTLFDEEKFPGYYAMRNIPAEGVAVDPVQRRRELEELIQKHPANRQSVAHRPDATEGQREELKNLRVELSEVCKKMAGQKVGSNA